LLFDGTYIGIIITGAITGTNTRSSQVGGGGTVVTVCDVGTIVTVGDVGTVVTFGAVDTVGTCNRGSQAVSVSATVVAVIGDGSFDDSLSIGWCVRSCIGGIRRRRRGRARGRGKG
jgi:hypothetical protein